MKLHEYQARDIFIKYGVPMPEGDVVTTAREAKNICAKAGKPVAIKAQVLVGGRGKAGGVKIAKDPQEAEQLAGQILGMQIKGYTVEKVLVVEAIEYSKEIYLGITIDRSKKRIVIIGSPCGGVEIEETAKTSPEKVFKGYDIKAIAEKIDPVPSSLIERVYKLFIENDCSLAEINPLVVTSQGKLLACDTKINIDDNALYRHPELVELRDLKAEDPLEVEARQNGLSYIGLTGDVACIVNGAGLAMATMDGIKLSGAEPANFLDVGGSSSPKKTLKALEIITANEKVKSILINIFGGITRCDDIAAGIIQALDSIKIKCPIVVRLTGTNQDKAREMLKGTDLVFSPTMGEAIKKVVELKINGV